MKQYRVTVLEKIVEKITVTVHAESEEKAEEEAIRMACEEPIDREFVEVRDRWVDEVEAIA